LVLAFRIGIGDKPPSKKTTAIPVLNVGLTDRFGIEWASEALGDAHNRAALGV